MKKLMRLNSEFGGKLLLSGGVFVSRLGWLPANVSPLGSFGFFGQNFWLFAGVIFLFDWLKGGFYPGFVFTYLGFAGYYLLGRLSRGSLTRQSLALPMASFWFFLISNFGVWLYWYPHTWQGLISCYSLAVPFYRQTLWGDVIFGYGYLVCQYLWSRRYVTYATPTAST